MKRLPVWVSVPLIIAAVVLHGCDAPKAKKAAAPVATPAVPPVAPTPPVVTSDNTPAAPVAQTQPAEIKGDLESTPAEAGVALQGRSLDEHEGMLVTPVKSLFAFKEGAVFKITIPHTLQLYKAENGEGPKSHDEFMEKIVRANQIELPKLPDGHSYRFDPDMQELMVVRPKK